MSSPEALTGGGAGWHGASGDAAATPGHGRFELTFEPNLRQVRVPPGVTLFDAASWNGVAIDSTCGGHGTCKKVPGEGHRR